MHERALVWIAAVALAAGMLGLGEFLFADSWLYAGAALAVSVAGFVVGSIAIQWKRAERSAVPTNTQLQQPPPAIIQPLAENQGPTP